MHLGSVVTVYDEDMEESDVYTIVSITEVDAMAGKISVESPVGAALLRKKVALAGVLLAYVRILDFIFDFRNLTLVRALLLARRVRSRLKGLLIF